MYTGVLSSYQYRLSDKMCTFAHSYFVFLTNTKVTQKGWIPSEEFSLNFGHTVQVLADTNKNKGTIGRG